MNSHVLAAKVGALLRDQLLAATVDTTQCMRTKRLASNKEITGFLDCIEGDEGDVALQAQMSK